METHIKNLPADLEKSMIEKLNNLCTYARGTISLLEANGSCEEVFEQFSRIKHATREIEGIMLTNQLKKCFLTEVPKLRELFTTIQSMRNKGYGALIVIERKDAIEEIISRNNLGVIIDAKLSGKLLENIFYPGTPLHDGAAVIRGERIFSAGSVLPLTRQIVAEKKLGTRHMAALGLSEVCDAVVIVISEETKRVSIALRGELLLLEKISTLADFFSP